MTAFTAIANGLARFTGGSVLRLVSVGNVVAYVLAVLASLATFRLMIALTDLPTVGLWTLVLGFAVLIGIAEIGLGANLVRFVAARRTASRRLLLRLAAVGAIMCLLPAIVLALAVAWPIYLFAAARPDLPVDLDAVAALTGLALCVSIVNVAISVCSGLAEGIGRLAHRSAALLVYNLVTLACLAPGVAAFGPVGIGLANLAGLLVQLATVVAVLLMAARRLPRAGDEETVGNLLRGLFAGSAQNLGTLLARLTIEPVARFFVAIVGSLSVLAIFELALRVSNQFRMVAQTALQPLLYVGASDQDGLARRFEWPRAFTVRLSALMYLGLACLSPLISAAVLGQIEPGFIVVVVILGAGSALAINGHPGALAIAARGQFGLLLAITVASAVLNALLTGAGARLGGTIGAVAGLATTHAIAGLVFQRFLARLSERSLRSQFEGFWGIALTAVAVGSGLALAAHRLAPATVIALAAGSCLLAIAPGWVLVRMFFNTNK